jgi:uncharacterized RDD family membrane protein YckC
MSGDLIRIDTPESVDLALEPAGLGSRMLAAVVDGLVQGVAVFAIIVVAIALGAMADPFGPGGDLVVGSVYAILLLLLGLLFFLYKLLLEAFWNGQTLGKRVVGIRVVKANGLPVDFLQVLVRNLMRIVDYLPGYYILGSIVVLASHRGQRLGDMVAGTVVVRERRAALPTVPRALSFTPPFDLNVLREQVLRLSEQDLEPARGFWERRGMFESQARYRVALSVAQGLISRMGWQEQVMLHPEQLIEAVLFVRAQ